MKKISFTAAFLSPLLTVASCGAASSGDSTPASTPAPSAGGSGAVTFVEQELARFEEPWAAAFAPGSGVLFVTEKKGQVRWFDTASKRSGTVAGAPMVDYGGQGGLGDIAFLPWETSSALGTRTIYLSWAEAGDGETRGAALGRGQLVCDQTPSCAIRNLQVIWRQQPKVTGRGQYAHRIAFSPDRKYLFLSSGDRQHPETAQDNSNDLGTIVRLNLDGAPAAGNAFAGQADKAQDIWSWGHRNPLGLKFDAHGQLWDLEHGPAGGDEINRIVKGSNYGWPLVSGGDNYDGTPIPRNDTRPDLAQPAINWTPVIAPGDFLFYSGKLFPAMKGEAVIAGLKTQALIRVRIDGDKATEVVRYPMGFRVREIVEAPDGALLIFEDGGSGRLLRLTPG